jgi:HSP20 family protein
MEVRPMSMRGNPFEDIERMFERMSRQFEEFSRRWESGEMTEPWMPSLEAMAVDLVEHDDEFVATVDLPGYEREDVTINVTDSTLRIEATREEAVDEEEETYLHRERSHRSLQRSVRLPAEVDTTAVTAQMKNGVLTVMLPKTEADTGRDIEIE